MVTLSLFETVDTVLPWRGHRETVFECRRCGHTLDGSVDACPRCGSDGIARFEID